MRATLSDSIRIDTLALRIPVVEALTQALTIDNPQKALAERELLWGREHIDEKLRLYTFENGELVLPMGFIHAFRTGMAAMGVSIEWDDRRSHGQPIMHSHVVHLRDYQEPMCQAMLLNQVGVAEAPTGAGKTATTLEAIRRAGHTAVIIVEKMSLAEQWVDEIEKFMGIKAHLLGDGDVEYGHPITVALRQAIYARVDDFAEDGFFDYFGTVVVDEAHHAATAWTLIEILQRFTAFYRWGVTATPERDPEYFPILQAIVGPIVWETTAADAGEHLMTPSVKVLETSFDFDFEPTHEIEVQLPGGGTKKKVVRNNYNAMKSALCKDPRRNHQIVSTAVQEAAAGHQVLVVSREKEHLLEFERLLTGAPFPVYTLFGGDKRYIEIRDAINTAKTGSVLLSTVADEGLSIDRLDRVINAYPRRNPETMRQIIGRILRPFPGKTDAVVIDVRDGEQFVLRSQFQGRAQMLYGKEGWVVTR